MVTKKDYKFDCIIIDWIIITEYKKDDILNHIMEATGLVFIQISMVDVQMNYA